MDHFELLNIFNLFKYLKTFISSKSHPFYKQLIKWPWVYERFKRFSNENMRVYKIIGMVWPDIQDHNLSGKLI